MRNKILILLILISYSAQINAQNVSLNKFIIELNEVATDSVLQKVDSKLLALNQSRVNDSVYVEFLKYKYYLSDSLKNKFSKNQARLELLENSKYLKPEKYFKYLMKQGDYEINYGGIDVTMGYHFKAVSVAEEIANDTLLIKVFRRIGVNYLKTDAFELSLNYLNKAKQKAILIKDSLKIASCYMSLGNNYKNQTLFDTAMYYYNKSLNLSKEIKWKKGLAGNFNNIGNVYRKKGDLKKSIEFYNQAVKINTESNNLKWLSYNYNNLGNVYEDLNKNNKAIDYYKKSQKIKEELNDKYGQIASLVNISEVYSKIKDYKNAYKYLARYKILNNELANQNKVKLASEIEAKFQNEKKETEISKLLAEQKLKEAVILGQEKDLSFQKELRKKEYFLRIAFGIVLFSMLIALYNFWKNSKQRKKHLVQMTNSKIHLDQKNKEITDSINYAKRIQTAILPSKKLIAKSLKQSFVLYMPKDIVAGDFYWLNAIYNKVYFAVADCTGHGVPGALVSVVCNNALDLVIKEGVDIDPGVVLDKTTKKVQEQFSKTDQLVRDGMDIALCSIDFKTLELKYSGANNPLWIVRKGKLIEYKSTRQPIGVYDNIVKFETVTVQLKKDDMIYLSTDGFADQFGGEKGKKFMKRNFKDLLVTISQFPIDIQEEKLKEAFTEWLSDFDQIDDVCVMGVSV